MYKIARRSTLDGLGFLSWASFPWAVGGPLNLPAAILAAFSINFPPGRTRAIQQPNASPPRRHRQHTLEPLDRLASRKNSRSRVRRLRITPFVRTGYCLLRGLTGLWLVGLLGILKETDVSGKLLLAEGTTGHGFQKGRLGKS